MTTKICRLKGIKFSMCSLAIEWVDMIGNGDKDLAKQIRKNYLHKLGNLH
jgi:hypothetical protein